jgi:hypothetical protein
MAVGLKISQLRSFPNEIPAIREETCCQTQANSEVIETQEADA